MKPNLPAWWKPEREEYCNSVLLHACANAGLTAEQTLDELAKWSAHLHKQCTKLTCMQPFAPIVINTNSNQSNKCTAPNQTPDPPYLRAYTWYCGDECYCSEPRIVLIRGNGLVPKELWSGEFLSDEWGEPVREQQQGLAEAAKRFGIPWDSETEDYRVGITAEQAEELLR
jgi:hypothetical protein